MGSRRRHSIAILHGGPAALSPELVELLKFNCCPSSQSCPAVKSTTSQGGRQSRSAITLVAMFDLFRLWLGAVLRWFRTRRSLMLEAPVAASDVLRIHSETLMSPAFGGPSFSQTLDYARDKRLPPETTGWDSN